MDFKVNTRLSPASESAIADSLKEDLKVNINEEEEIDTEHSEKNKQKLINKKDFKKRRPNTSRTIQHMHEREFDFKKALRSSTEKTQQNELSQLKTKIKTNFQEQLKNELLSANQGKTANLIQDKISLQQKELDQINFDKQQKHEKETITKNMKKNQQQHQQMLYRPDISTPIKEYIALFGESLLKKSPEKQHQMNSIKQSLHEKGVSTKQLIQIEKGAQQIIQKDIKKLLKRNFTNLALTYSKQESIELLDSYTKFYNMQKTAKDLNLFNSNPNELSDLKELTKYEVSNFLSNELDRGIVETKINSNNIQDLQKIFREFDGISEFTQFNAQNYLKQFQKKLDDQGLKEFISPDNLGPLDSDKDQQSRDQSNQDNSTEHNEEHLSTEPETNLLNLYIKSHFTHGFIDNIKLTLDIKKMEKKHQSTLNITTIKKEAKHIATLRAKMKCRNLFEERATFPELQGPDYKQFKKQLKLILKTLKNLNEPLSKQQLIDIRDQSNRSMFSIIKEDYIKYNVFFESQPENKPLEYKIKQLFAILTRLIEETKIDESLTPKLMQDLHFLKDININEAA